MSVATPLRIGLFTHSTNPRGGVVHALELADALFDLGHDVCVHAPDASGFGFFRKARARCALVAARPVNGGVAELVSVRTGEYLAYLQPRGREFDIYHAHDSLSGSVLAELTTRRVIPSYVRTVHHLDDFADPFLRDTQERSVLAASQVLCVSRIWRQFLQDRYTISATVVPNGVDLTRFGPAPREEDRALRERLAPGDGPIFLAVGGIERRKNTLSTLRAFAELREQIGSGQLLIVGGASLLDHASYRREFNDALLQLPQPTRDGVRVVGSLSDEQMPSVYRLADALVFPSLREGFGLAVLESLACGIPVIVPQSAPFTEYLSATDALWVNPMDPSSIAGAMRHALDPAVRSRLAATGLARAAHFPWDKSALAHVDVYRSTISPVTGDAAHARDALSRAMAG